MSTRLAEDRPRLSENSKADTVNDRLRCTAVSITSESRVTHCKHIKVLLISFNVHRPTMSQIGYSVCCDEVEIVMIVLESF